MSSAASPVDERLQPGESEALVVEVLDTAPYWLEVRFVELAA